MRATIQHTLRGAVLTMLVMPAAPLPAQAPVFVVQSELSAVGYPASVEIADLDLDGRLDLVAPLERSQAVAAFLGSGRGFFRSTGAGGVGAVVGIHGQTQTDRSGILIAGQLERGLHRADDLVAHRLHFRTAGKAGQNQPEFVTADPGEDVRGAKLLAHALRRLAEQVIPGGVTEGVVHELEMVEIEEADHHLRAGRLRLAQRPLELLGVQAAVRERSQMVVESLMSQLT